MEMNKEDELQYRLERDYQAIRMEIFRIPISNALFYNKIGKYPQIMDLFKLIGFRRVMHQYTTAFSFLKDPTPDTELDEVWGESTRGAEAERTMEQLSRTTVLARRFEANRKGHHSHN